MPARLLLSASALTLLLAADAAAQRSRGFSMTPDESFDRMLQSYGGAGDVVDLARIPPDYRERLNRFAQFSGTEPLPTAGTLTREQYRVVFNQRMEAMRAKGFGGPRPDSNSPPPGSPSAPAGSPTPPPPPPSDPRDRERWEKEQRERDKDREKEARRAEEERKKAEDAENARPTVIRFGKLPKEAPTWFESLDGDADGQVGLYEWRKDGRSTAEFVAMDLNGDGYLTADEWMRYTKLELDKKPDESASSSRSEARGDKRGGGNNPFTGGRDKGKGDKK